MGCSTLELDATVDVRDWGLENPAAVDDPEARVIRDQIRKNVNDLFDELGNSYC